MFNLKNLCNSLVGIGLYPDIDLFKKLFCAYTEPHRYYHTTQHIAECLVRFHTIRHLGTNPSEIEVALWFHDAIYNTLRSDNEVMSAKLARQYLIDKGADTLVVQRIVDMIIATKTHNVTEGDTALLLDVDLSILGANESAFEAYDRAIRLEYQWVSIQQYKAGRAKILKSFLEKEQIYQTREFQDVYEEQARYNLERKVKELTIVV